MSVFLNPAFNTFLDTQLGNISYMFRDAGRVSGEWVGLPQAVPNERKMDYQFRHFHNVFLMTFLGDLGYKIVERLYMFRNFVDFIGLNKLTQQDPIHHLPDVKPIDFDAPPQVIRDHMLGGLIKTDSYPQVPRLIKEKYIEPNQKKLKELITAHGEPSKPVQDLKNQINEQRLVAHRLQQIFTPEAYIDDLLVKQNHITADEGKLLKDQLQKLKQAKSLFEKIKKALGKEGLDAVVQAKDNNLLAELEQIIDADPKNKTPIHHLIDEVTNRLRMRSGKEEFRRRTALAKIIQGPTLLERVGLARKQHIYQHAPKFQLVKRLSDVDTFVEELYQKLFSTQSLKTLERLESQNTTLLKKLYTDLAADFMNSIKLVKVYQGGGFWLKLAASVVLISLGGGSLVSTIDVKYIQPYQRKIVRERGDATEFLAPGYLGAIPALLTFGLMSRSKFIQNLGHVNSYLLTGLASFAVFAASTYSMFQMVLTRPPKTKKPIEAEKATPPVPPQPVNPFAQKPMMSPVTATYFQV